MNFYRALEKFIQGNIYFIAAHHILKNSHTADNQTLFAKLVTPNMLFWRSFKSTVPVWVLAALSGSACEIAMRLQVRD
jgi:hypothetical protein